MSVWVSRKLITMALENQDMDTHSSELFDLVSKICTKNAIMSEEWSTTLN